MLYVDFDLEIGPGVGREYPVAARSKAGQTHGKMRFPFGELELENALLKLEKALLQSGDTRRRALSEQEQAVQDFGRALFEALLEGDLRSFYYESKREATRQGHGLRLRLHIRAPELAALPWEYLYDPRVPDYLCLSRGTPLVRYLDLAHPIEPLTVAPPLQILAMIASPGDQDALDTARERERMRQALEPLEQRGMVRLTWLEGQTWRDLQRAMRSGPWHIFHFIGHGAFDRRADEGALALADDDGQTYLIHATQVGRMLADHSTLRLVILNACEGARGGQRDLFSSTAATLAQRGIPAVLAMQYEISDRAAIELTRAFYESLSDGLAVDAALAEARTSISLGVHNSLEWGTPVLFLRAQDGVLFEVQGKPLPRSKEASSTADTTPAPSATPTRSAQPEQEAPEQPQGPPTKTKEQWVTEGERQRADSRFAEALSAFEHAIELDPRYALAHRGKSIALFELKRYNEALAAADRAIQLDPNDEVAYHNKGSFLRHLGRYEEALAAFDRAIELAPDDVSAAVQRYNTQKELEARNNAQASPKPPEKTKEDWLKEGDALVHYRVKRYAEALARYEEALKLDPTFSRALSGKAEALNELKRYEEALAAAERVIRLDPKNARAHNSRGDALWGFGRYEEALVAFERATQLDSRYALAHKNKGVALSHLKRYQEALVACERAIQLDPQDARAYSEKGNTLNSLNRYEEALAACERAIQLDPQSALAYHNKGAALYYLNRYEEALAAAEQAIQLDPGNATSNAWKGVALQALGRKAEAEQAFQKARKLGWK